MNDPLGLFDDDAQQDPLGLFVEEPSFGAKIKSGLKKNFANLGNTFDTAVSLPAAGLARMAGGDYNKLFKELNKREKSRNEWAGDVDPGFVGNLAGVLNPLTLPATVAAMPVSGFQTAKQFIDEGESVGKAIGAGVIDTAANFAGMALPGFVPGTRAVRAASGAAANVVQDTASRAAIAGLADNDSTKKMFAPSMETAALAAVPGAVFGAAAKNKPKAKLAVDPELDNKIDSFFVDKTASEGRLGGELPGEVNMDLFKRVQEQDAVRKQQEYTDALEAQRVMEAEQFVAKQYPEQPTTGLSTGEGMPGNGKPVTRVPTTDSGLMGLPPKPVEPPVGLSTGEGKPGQGGNVTRAPVTDSGLMGVEPKPFDPFGSAGASPKRISKFGQGGQAPIIGDLAEGLVRLGGMLRGKKTGQAILPPDSLAEPRSPEMVKTKLEKSAKAGAIGLKGTVYNSPGSLEELRANPGKDIGFSKIGVGSLAYEFDSPKSPGQFLGSGAEAVVRRNTANNSTKYVRGLYSKARNLSENLVHKYVTGPGALTTALRGLDTQDKLTAYQLVQKLSKERQNYTPELADHLGLSTAVRNYMEVRQVAFKGQFDFSASVNAKLGFKQFEELGGYSPTNFDSAYRTLVYEVVKDKSGVEKQKIVSVVNANSAWQRKAGVELYKERAAKDKLNYKFVELETRGLKKDTSPNKQFDAMATMLAKMAELDPRFAEAKAEIDSLIAEKTKKLYSFNVHEMHKKGVEGGIGNKPWLSLEKNADDFFKMEIDHLDTGFRYWSYQDAITKTRQFVTDPTIDQPNAKRWAEQYTERIAGQKLNPLGGVLNWTIDLLQTPIGMRGSKNAYNALGAARAVGNAWLMGIWNPMFMIVQSSQLIVNGLTEAARMRVDLDIPHSKMASALPNAVAAWTYLTAMDKTGRWDKAGMFGDLKDDFKWAQEHGLSTYSEVALSHEAAMDPKVRLAKDIAMHPTTLPEYFTRPTTFLWYTQMFREAGYTGEQARIAARDATDYAMTNYQADELPMMYKDLGVSGKNIGSLRAFVHNNTDQFIARAMEANKYPAAFSTMMGMTLLLQGITGVVGYSLANELSMVFTDKTLTEWMEELLEPQNRKYLNGFVSAWTDADIQSRFSTADVLPGSFAEGLVGPQISKFGKVLVAGYEYGKNQDEASLLKLGKELTPSGMVGIFEDKFLTDEQGFVLKDGKRKYDEPRTQAERDLRRQYNTRPLKEKMSDEALYRDNQRMGKMTDKQAAAYDRMKTALALGDMAGFKAAQQKYKEEKGNPESIARILETAKADAKKSERERKQGELTDSWESMQRFKNYQE